MSIFSTVSSRIRSQMNRTAGGDPNDPENYNSAASRQQTENMTTLEQDLKKQILGRSKAEKTFRPWWDTLEDYLLNSLVLLGKSFFFVMMKITSGCIIDTCAM